MDLADLLLLLFAFALLAAVGQAIRTLLSIFINRSDVLRVADHGLTWWRHKRAKELDQFNKDGQVVNAGSRSFTIRHERSDETDRIVSRVGVHGYVLVQERLRSRFWNGYLNRGPATGDQFQAAMDAHIASQSGWLRMVKARPVAEDVKSVVEHADIYRLFYVSLWPAQGAESESPDKSRGV